MGQEIRELYMKTEVLFRRTSIPFELFFNAYLSLNLHSKNFP